MRRLSILALLFWMPVSAQQPNVSGGTPGVERPGPQAGCPLRAVKARIEKISPQGELVLAVKGRFMPARLTSETRYDIPGYSRKALREGTDVKLEPDTEARLRICEWNGEVYHLKVLPDGKKEKKKDK